MFVLAVMAVAAPAASAAPWVCDGTGYVTQFDATNSAAGTSFNRADPQPDGTVQLTQLGTVPAEHVNAIAFRPQDGFVYALNNTTGQIMRIERDPATGEMLSPTPIGSISGSGLDPASQPVIGTILPDGTYLIWGPSTTPGEQVGAIFDVSGPTAQFVSTVTPADQDLVLQGDVAVNPVDGQLYGVNPDPSGGDPNPTWGVYQWALSGGTLTRGPRVGDAASAGAAWFRSDGTFLMYVNGTVAPPGTPPEGAGLYSIDVATGERRFLRSGPVLSNVDGTACANGIALTKDASPRTVTAGGELTYTYTIRNSSVVDAPVDFVDQLPAGMTYVPGGVTVSPAFGTPNNYAGTNMLSISGSMAAGSTATVTARVQVAATAPCNTNVPNQAQGTLSVPGLPPVTVDSDDPTTPADPANPINDPTNVRVNCPPPPPPAADVTVNKTASDSRVTVGDMVTYRLVVKNNGPGVATGTTVNDPVPSQLDVRSASSTQGDCSVSGNRVSCTVGTLAVGQEVTVTVRARAIRAGGTTNKATVDTPNCTAHPCDEDPAKVTAVKPPLRLSKSVGKRTLRAGETTRYTIRVSNPSKVALRNVRTCDRLPAGLVYVSSKPKAKLSKGQHCWRVKSLRAGKSKTYRVTVRALPGASGRKVNTATATSPNARAAARAKRAVRVIAGGLLPDALTG